MMKYFFALMLIPLIGKPCFAQFFNKRFSVENRATLQNAVLSYPNFHILFGSNYNPQYTNGLKTYIIKANHHGEFIDSVFVNKPQRKQFIPLSPNGLKDEQDSVFLFTGGSLATDGIVRLILVKVDTTLNVHFAKEYEWTGNQVFKGMHVQKDDDGGYLITGYVAYANYDYDVFLLKTDNQGNELWRQSYGAGNLFDWGQNVLRLSNGNILLSGYSENGNPTGGFVSPRIYLVETDSVGNPLWEWQDPDTSTVLNHLIPSQDGGFIGVGSYITFRSRWESFRMRPYVVKFDSNKQKVWEKMIGMPLQQTWFNDVVELANGDLIVCGNTGVDIPTEQKNTVGCIRRLSADGDTIWSRFYKGVDSSPKCCGENTLYDLEVLPDGSIIASGQADDNTEVNGYPYQQGWLLHIDSNGCLLPGSCGVTEVEEVPNQEENLVKLYPNPVSDQLTIEYAFRDVKDASLIISDLNGRVAYSKEIALPQYLYTIDVSDWINGIYYYRIANNHTSVASGRIVVIK